MHNASFKFRITLERWFMILTFFASCIAVIISLQANKLAKEANVIMERSNEIAFEGQSTDIKINKSNNLEKTLYLGMCGNLKDTTVIRFYFRQPVTVVNNGGKPTSIVSIKSSQETLGDLVVRVYENADTANSENLVIGNEINLPYTLQAGDAVSWIIEPYIIKYFSTNEEISNVLKSVMGNETKDYFTLETL